jgi:hypothetical protein
MLGALADLLYLQEADDDDEGHDEPLRSIACTRMMVVVLAELYAPACDELKEAFRRQGLAVHVVAWAAHFLLAELFEASCKRDIGWVAAK